jgi:DNA invertase Pin-like site-specific DNA recombinase
LAKYAIEHGLAIVEAYADEGRSGLNFRGRPALQGLIQDVRSPTRPFDVLLVLDISRWGRFQNTDESAYYEFICWSAGVQVVYCAEPFPNDGSPTSTILKGMKRVMAGEYSRELSRRVYSAKLHKAKLGFYMGGTAPFGLRRACVSGDGQMKGMMLKGEHKSFEEDHMQLIPGPREEVRLVRRIFRLFVDEQRGASWIAHHFNREGIPSPSGMQWSEATVRYILRNQAYTGTSVYNHFSTAMKTRKVAHDVADQVHLEKVFPGLISQAMFDAAQAHFPKRRGGTSNARLLDELRVIYQKHGQISRRLIDAEGIVSASLYSHRFGSLLLAYQLAKVAATRPSRFLESRAQVDGVVKSTVKQMMSLFKLSGHHLRLHRAGKTVCVDETVTIQVKVVLPHQTSRDGQLCWRFRVRPLADFYLVVRLDDDMHLVDFHLFPAKGLAQGEVCLRRRNGPITDAHRFDAMTDLLPFAHRLFSGEIDQPPGRFGSCPARAKKDRTVAVI